MRLTSNEPHWPCHWPPLGEISIDPRGIFLEDVQNGERDRVGPLHLYERAPGGFLPQLLEAQLDQLLAFHVGLAYLPPLAQPPWCCCM